MGDVKRCKVCDWPLAASAEEGCVEGDCSYRPSDPAEQARIRERRAKLAEGFDPHAPQPDTRDEVERIRLRARGGVTMWSDADVQNLLARIATLEAERDLGARSFGAYMARVDQIGALLGLPNGTHPDQIRNTLAARLPSPAAVRAARVLAAERIEQWSVHGSPDRAREVANVCADDIRDIADGHSGRHDQGGDVDEPTMLVIAQRVARCTTLGELEEMARELREVE